MSPAPPPSSTFRTHAKWSTFTGEQIKDLPTSRNVNSLLAAHAGHHSNYRPTSPFGAPGVCVGGIGVFCNPGVAGFNVGDAGRHRT